MQHSPELHLCNSERCRAGLPATSLHYVVASMQEYGYRGSAELSQVFDSAAALELISREELYDIYNSQGQNSTFDSRSDNKGKSSIFVDTRRPWALGSFQITGSSLLSHSNTVPLFDTPAAAVGLSSSNWSMFLGRPFCCCC